MFKIQEKPKPLILCILDGWGVSQDSPGNAITRANPINFNSFWFSFPHTLLIASGQAVGLPEGQVGNSEVGHLNLGAGRVVFQDLLRINTAIADATFYENQSFLDAVAHIKEHGSNIHLMGLAGLGSVHSQIEHLYALLSFIKKQQLPASKVKIHIFTDGRDSPPASAKLFVSQLKSRLEQNGLGQIASISGRYYSMDRDNRWERTAKAYKALLGNAEIRNTDPLAAIDKSYAEAKTDEFIEPLVIVDENNIPVGPISENDAVIFFNYRPDRARQITEALITEDLTKQKSSSGEKIQTFERGPKLKNLFFVSLTEYAKGMPVNRVAFSPEEVTMPIARIFSERNAKQLHIAETEKYAHVTYFFNGGLEKPFSGEDRILIDSPKVASYDLKPEMSAPEITKQLIARINTRAYDFIVVNFANADMVSHSGKIDATLKAVQCVDFQLGLIVKTTLGMGGGVIITADHGNAEEMLNLRTGEVDTEHNNSPVPCVFIFKELQGSTVQLPRGLLADVAPTILGILQIPKPSQMTGRSLL
ncbi:2,3-bisphosphoglycerate-independent phosphoglycerate mutase [Candidatus Curtissbacteria bacterium]|nr:2,3-bisphosphoglycerate-independent phosphoglycerate mutase [Candidatus Curtissbacteria bacterium]